METVTLKKEKEQIIQRVRNTYNREALREVAKILAQSDEPEEDRSRFTPEQAAAIDRDIEKSIEQVERGEYYTEEQAKALMKEWRRKD